MKKNLIKGVIFALLGVIIIVWSINNSPYAAFGEQAAAVLEGDSFVLSKFQYYGALVTGTLLTLLGIRTAFRKV